MVCKAVSIPPFHKIIGVRVKLIAQRINEGSPLVFVVDFKIKVLGFLQYKKSIMIISFRDRKTEKLFNGEPVSKLNEKLAQKDRRRLELLNAAQKIEDLYFPASNKFHALEGFNPKRYAVWVNKQWRISFIWEESNNAIDVYFEDYH